MGSLALPLCALLLLLLPGPALFGQEPAQPAPTRPESQEPGQQEPTPQELIPGQDRTAALEGKIIREIRVARIGPNGQIVPLDAEPAEAIVRGLASKANQPLDLRKIRTDVDNLWHERRLVTGAWAAESEDQVVLIIGIRREDEVYERIEFKGLDHFPQSEVDELLGIYPDRQVTRFEAMAMRNVLLARYKRDGYVHCTIDFEERLPEGVEPVDGQRVRSVLVFRLDEGPQVTVRYVYFRGNYSFLVSPHLGMFAAGDTLIRDSGMESGPGWLFTRGDPFSREVIEEDLDRLRIFYRSRGFLDAEVELATATYTDDQSEVDLTFLVQEDPRYRISAVRLERVDPAGGKPIPESEAYYPTEEVMAALSVETGDFYDNQQILRDVAALRDFYGDRGHPAKGLYELNIPDAFSVGPPRERYTEDAQVELTFEVVEGTPKTLREVVIRGNTFTKDKVIRRKVFQMPGERLDMSEIQRSVRVLNGTRYFQDPVTLEGPRFELLPVTGQPEYLDLAIDVTEGDTGEFRWGVGISSGAGLQGSIQFNKRNFDLFKLPSSPNPVTVLSEIIDSTAFHGAGQRLDLLLAPGTEISQFVISFTEPDLFGSHFDTIGLRVSGRRRLRRYRDGYVADTLGMDVGLTRHFTEEFSAGVSVRHETVEIDDIDADAATIVFRSEGQTELRGVRAQTRWRDLDLPRRPTDGFDALAYLELVGGPWGGEVDFVKGWLSFDYYLPLHEDELERRHVLHMQNAFGWSVPFGGSDEVFLNERFFLGGRNLRGFDFRDAGPSQFGKPVGGEAMYTARLEYLFPLVSTRAGGQVRDTELLRGVLFTDAGFLGLTIDDATFREPRLSVGVGVRIDVPVLGIPIALDLGWPILFEETDDRRQLYFSIQY